MIREAFEDPVKVRGEDGRVFWMPKIKAAATQLANAGAKGDGKAVRLMIELLDKIGYEPVTLPPEMHIHFVDPPNHPESPAACDSQSSKQAKEEEDA